MTNRATRNGRSTCHKFSCARAGTSAHCRTDSSHLSSTICQPNPASSEEPKATNTSHRAGTRNRLKPGSRAKIQLNGLNTPNARKSPTSTRATVGSTPGHLRHCHAPMKARKTAVIGTNATYSLNNDCPYPGNRARVSNRGCKEKESTSLGVNPPWRLESPISSSVGSS